MVFFNEKSKKEQTHIIDGKIVKNYYFNPFHNKKNKKELIDILFKKIGADHFEKFNSTNKIFEVKIKNKLRVFSIDTTDHGGREDGAVKVEIPFSNSDFKKAIINEEFISVINMYIPLLTFNDGFSPDIENIIFIILNPIQIYVSSPYADIFDGKKSISSSSRWTKIQEIFDIYKSKGSAYAKPGHARMAKSAWHYMKFFHSKEFNLKSFLEFEQMDFDKQITDWKEQAKWLSQKYVSHEKKIFVSAQKIFRNSLLDEARNMCSIDGCEEKDKKFLIASHIKPRAAIKTERKNEEISEEEMKNQLSTSSNGFCLCRKHDAIFDKGRISIDDHLNIIWSKKYNGKKNKIKFLEKIILLKDKKYISFHRKYVFN